MEKTLYNARAGEELIVVATEIETDWFSGLGFHPGSLLTLLTRSAFGVTVRLRGIKYALGRPLAHSVIVRPAIK